MVMAYPSLWRISVIAGIKTRLLATRDGFHDVMMALSVFRSLLHCPSPESRSEGVFVKLVISKC